MKTFTANDFNYVLPPERIAQYPSDQRGGSRLLVLDRHLKKISHQHFIDFIDMIDANDLLIFNDTKVIPARLLGYKTSGGKIECLVERLLSEKVVLAHVRASKSPKPGSVLILAKHIRVRV